MTKTTHPSKEQVRELMVKRRQENTPPPSPEQIREQLGWKLIEAERQAAREAN